MNPDCPVLRSARSMRSPCVVSCMVTTMRSPEFMKRSVAPFGVNVMTVELTMLGGGHGAPVFGMKAEMTRAVLNLGWRDVIFCASRTQSLHLRAAVVRSLHLI